MARKTSFYAICPLGLEELLAQELKACAATEIKTARGGVFFAGSQACAMRACLNSRLASRILMRLASSDYYDEEDIYNFACRTKWEEHFGPEQSIRIDINAHRSPLRSLDFTLLRIKDGICDRFNHFMQTRPDVDRVHPDVRIFAFVDQRYCTFYLDMCGEALFKRGWRRDKGEAPLKENLASGLLMLAGWQPESPLLDPFCGSGTIAIEAAARAGVNRHAKVSIHASDISSIVVEKAIENAKAAGLGALLEDGRLVFERCDAREVKAPASSGLLIANPPYGEQSNPKSASVASMMKNVSDNLKHNFAGWSAWLLTSDRSLPRQMRLSESRKIPLFNGPLECRFFKFEMVSGSFRQKNNQQDA